MIAKDTQIPLVVPPCQKVFFLTIALYYTYVAYQLRIGKYVFISKFTIMMIHVDKRN